jgi:hypothetical protein
MPKATGEWVDAGSVRMPVMILTSEDHMDEVGPIWMARSILTGHVTAGTTEERAKECLRRTVAGSIELAQRYGKPFDEWFREQHPAEPQYVEQYFRCAADVGREVAWTSPARNAVAVAPS